MCKLIFFSVSLKCEPISVRINRHVCPGIVYQDLGCRRTEMTPLEQVNSLKHIVIKRAVGAPDMTPVTTC